MKRWWITMSIGLAIVAMTILLFLPEKGSAMRFHLVGPPIKTSKGTYQWRATLTNSGNRELKWIIYYHVRSKDPGSSWRAEIYSAQPLAAGSSMDVPADVTVVEGMEYQIITGYRPESGKIARNVRAAVSNIPLLKKYLPPLRYRLETNEWFDLGMIEQQNTTNSPVLN